MATLQELEGALINAHRAGDTNAARYLAGEIARAQESVEPAKPVGPAPGYGERFMRGVEDTGTGLAQLWKMATNPEEAKRYTAKINAETADYDARRGKDAGVDWVRVAGNIVSTAPTMFIPGGQATLPARLGMAALSGGLVGGAQFSKTGDWSDKAVQIGVGAGAGALGQGAVEAVTKVGSAAINKVASALRGRGDVTDDVVIAQFRSAGVDWDALGDNVKQSLVADARKALSGGGQLDAVAAARVADAKAAGVELTQGQALRNPRQWTFERNTAKIANVGDPLNERFAAQDKALAQGVKAAQARTGGATTDPAIASDNAMKALRAFDEANTKAEASAWQAAREALGGEAQVPLQTVAQKYGQLLDDVPDLIPAGVKSRMEKFGVGGGTQTKNFTVTEADSLIKQLNRYYDRNNDARNRVLGELKGVINQTLDDFDPAAQKLGAEAVEKFRTARDLSRNIRQGRDATPGLQAALDDADPVRFLNRYVLGSDPRQIASMRDAMLKAEGGQQAWNDLRGEVINKLMKEGVNSAGDRFKPDSFRSALDSIGQSRLKELFTPAELSQLNLISRVGKMVSDEPASTAVNRSNTASAVFNVLQRVGEVPYLGPVTAPLRFPIDLAVQQSRRNAATRALSPSLPTVQSMPAITPEMQAQIRAILSRSIVPSSAAAAAYGVANQ